MEIKQMLITKNPYSRPANKRSKTTKVAIHYIGNAGSSATANRNYFNNLANQSGNDKRYASSHYIVGLQGEIVQCIPEDEIAYTTNSANAYSIGIEVCHPKSDGVFTDVTRKALVELVADICKRYNLNPMDDIIRHYDITGKMCPLAWASNSGEKYQDYIKFKNEVVEFNNKPKYTIQKVKVNLFGDVRNVNSININDTNHIKLRDLNCDKLKVEWKNNKVYVNNKPFDVKGITYQDYNYVKVKDLARVGIKVGWDNTTKMILLDD